nr:putative apolipoprotein B-100 protein [bacterium]
MVVPPAVTLSKPVNVFDNFTFNVLPSDTTPILLSVKSAAAAPPLMATVPPSFLLIVVPESPSKFKPLSTSDLDATSLIVTVFV